MITYTLKVITDALHPVLASVLVEGDLEVMRQKLNRVRIPARPLLTARNWRGAFGVMLMVFLARERDSNPRYPYYLPAQIALASPRFGWETFWFTFLLF